MPTPSTPSRATCVDTPGYSDDYGTCATYSSNFWCANGGKGVLWKPEWGDLSASAKAACCACGKAVGIPCEPLNTCCTQGKTTFNIKPQILPQPIADVMTYLALRGPRPLKTPP